MSDLSAFGVNHGYESVSKLNTPMKPMGAALTNKAARQNVLNTLVKPYKGGTQKTKSSLPLQAKLAGARLDRKRGRI